MTSSASIRTGNLWVAGCVLLAATTLFAITSAIADPIAGLVAAAAVAIPFLVLQTAAAPQVWVLLILISKPIVDLAWRWKFMQVGEQGVNIQTVVALIVIVLTTLAVVLRARNVLIYAPVIVFGLCAGLSVLMTPTVGSLNELLRHYAGMCFFLVAPIALQSERDLQRFAKWLVAMVAVPVALSFLQLAEILPYEYFDDTDKGHLSRVSGTYQHPLGLVYFLMIAVPLALMLIHRNRRKFWIPASCWVFIAGSLVALAFTYHRAGIAAVAMEILLWFLLTKQYGKAGLVVLAGVIVAFLMADWVSMLYKDVGTLNGPVDSDTLRGRGANWYAFVWAYIHGNPLNWLFGFGESVATAEVPGMGLYTSLEAHTDFLRILYIYGLAGLSLYLGILFVFFQRALRLYRCRVESLHVLGALAIVVFSAVCLLTVTSEPMRYPTAAWYFFVLGAVVLVKDRERRADLTIAGQYVETGAV